MWKEELPTSQQVSYETMAYPNPVTVQFKFVLKGCGFSRAVVTAKSAVGFTYG
jgi:hypothetical protein